MRDSKLKLTTKTGTFRAFRDVVKKYCSHKPALEIVFEKRYYEPHSFLIKFFNIRFPEVVSTDSG